MVQQYFSIKNCDFAFKCPRDWQYLGATGKEDERYCTSCEKPVYLCIDDSTLARHVRAGHCVAVEDSTKVGGVVIGQVSTGYSAGIDSLPFDTEAGR